MDGALRCAREGPRLALASAMAPSMRSAYCESVGRQAVQPSAPRRIVQPSLVGRSVSTPARRFATLVSRCGLNVLLAALWLWFAEDHLVFWASTGDFRGIGAMAMEAIVAILFLTRRSSLQTSREPLAWGATVVGAFGPLLMRPVSSGGGGTAALVLQLAGAFFVCVSLAFLGRSFGLVPANRGIVAQGPLSDRPAPDLPRLLRGPGRVRRRESVRAERRDRRVCDGRSAREDQLRGEGPHALIRAYADYKRRVRFRLVPFVY